MEYLQTALIGDIKKIKLARLMWLVYGASLIGVALYMWLGAAR